MSTVADGCHHQNYIRGAKTHKGVILIWLSYQMGAIAKAPT